MLFPLCLSFVNYAHRRKSFVAEVGEREKPGEEQIVCRGTSADVEILQAGRLLYLFTGVSCCAPGTPGFNELLQRCLLGWNPVSGSSPPCNEDGARQKF